MPHLLEGEGTLVIGPGRTDFGGDGIDQVGHVIPGIQAVPDSPGDPTPGVEDRCP
jgi:hypothetical protein